GDARIAIDEVLSGSESQVATPRSLSRIARPLLVLSAVLTAALTALVLVHFREQPKPAELMRFQIPAPVRNKLYKGLALGSGSSVSISPDGRRLAFNALGSDNRSEERRVG